MARGRQRAGPGTVYSLAGTCSGGDLAGVGLWPPRIGEGPGVQERPPHKSGFYRKDKLSSVASPHPVPTGVWPLLPFSYESSWCYLRTEGTEL